MMKLLEVLGKIAWVRSDFLSQSKISDIRIRCARPGLMSYLFAIDNFVIVTSSISESKIQEEKKFQLLEDLLYNFTFACFFRVLCLAYQKGQNL